MSIYFNQTNLAPGTALFSTGGGGSGSNFPSGISTPSIVGLSSINGAAYSSGGGGSNFPSGITIGNGSITPEGSEGVMIMNNQIRVGGGGVTANTIITPSEVYFQVAGTGSTKDFVVFDGDTNTLSNIAGINGGAPVVAMGNNMVTTAFGVETLDAGGLATVTLPTPYKDTGYTVLLTMMSGQPTIAPWAKITSNDTFEIAGDSNAGVGWATFGFV
jgi:hypothetical protein